MIGSGEGWYRGYAEFVFRDTAPTDIGGTLDSLGAHSESSANRSWVFPGPTSPLLDFFLEDFDTYYAELTLESLGSYAPLLMALGADCEDALLLHVSVRATPEAFLALRTFTLTLLENHQGVARNETSNRVWTRQDLAELRGRNDWTRLAGSGGPTGNREPA